MKNLIIDGNNLIHRTYWTAKTQSKKTNTDSEEQLSNFHIYFTLNAINSYVTKYKPTQTIVVWDQKKEYIQNKRKDIYEEYKTNRTSDSSPHQNNDVIQQILSYLGIKSVFPRSYEADDIVAHITQNVIGSHVIVSADQDFLQLVDKNTILFDPVKKREFNIKNFKEKTGWTKDEWLKAKCCLGDKSDNVPGIPKFGKVKVEKFVRNELQLTKKQQEIYDRNLSLFDLSVISEDDEESKYYSEQLFTTVNPDWNNFLNECEKRQFKSILSKKESWYSTYFITFKLNSLFQ